MTSDEPLPDRCGAECRDGGYCTQYPVGGSDRCRMHGGTQPTGADSPNFKHGGYSKYLADYLTEEEHERARALFEDLEDPENVQDIARAIVTDLWTRYQRTGDTQFIRELRQVCDTFGLAPEDVLQVEHSGSVDHEHTHELDDRQRAHLDAVTEGVAEIDVEPVEEA